VPGAEVQVAAVDRAERLNWARAPYLELSTELRGSHEQTVITFRVRPNFHD
jgi:hypothetical protein